MEKNLSEVIFLDQGENEPDEAKDVHCKGNQPERESREVMFAPNKMTQNKKLIF